MEGDNHSKLFSGGEFELAEGFSQAENDMAS